VHFTKRGFGGSNALVWCEDWLYTSSTNGRVATVIFRIRNTVRAVFVHDIMSTHIRKCE
jgi:hypothetical protein